MCPHISIGHFKRIINYNISKIAIQNTNKSKQSLKLFAVLFHYRYVFCVLADQRPIAGYVWQAVHETTLRQPRHPTSALLVLSKQWYTNHALRPKNRDYRGKYGTQIKCFFGFVLICDWLKMSNQGLGMGCNMFRRFWNFQFF